MSSLTALTGRAGKVEVDDVQVARITNWSVNPTLGTSSEWGDSDCAGYTARAAGRRDATFTCEGKFDTGSEIWDAIVPGGNYKVELFLNDTLKYEFARALCTDFSLTVDVDTEEVIGWTASFGTDGTYTLPT